MTSRTQGCTELLLAAAVVAAGCGSSPAFDTAAFDLADCSPDGSFVFVAFRGPAPLSGGPHIATGSTPGLGIVAVTDGGRNGRVRGIARTTNVGEDGVERADPHAVRGRRVSGS
jgi:hypothetical protein